MKSILKILLLTLSIFLLDGCENNILPNEKPLKIKIVHNKPCFYIDKFDGMDKFNIQSISVEGTWDNPKVPHSTQWREGYQIFALDFHRGISRPIGKVFLFSPSAIAGSDKCVEYGLDIVSKNGVQKELKVDSNYTNSDFIALSAEINTALSPVNQITNSDIIILPPMNAKELKTNVIYSIHMGGWNKEQWYSRNKKVQDIDFYTSFYLKKNSQTGDIEAVVVTGNEKVK